MGNLMERWKALPIWQQGLILMGLVGTIVFSLISMRPETTEILYSNLDVREAQEIRTEISKLGLSSQLNADGTAISIEAAEIPRVQAYLATMGLPSSGDPGFELFDENSVGSTMFDKERKYERALVGDIQKGLVQGFDFVEKAVVQLNFDMKDTLFEEADDSKASVAITPRNAQELSEEQVQAIRHFVASSVKNLTGENVEVMDKNGIVYESSDQAGSSAGYTKQMQIQEKTEERIKKDIMATMSKVFGAGNVTLNVRARINFDEIVRNIEKYDPEGTLVSRQEKQDDASKSSEVQNLEPGTDANGEVPNYTIGDNTGEEAYRQNKEEIIENFEVGKTVETIKKNPELTNVAVTATINKAINEADMADFVAEWEEIIANAAGIQQNQDGTLENGSVKVSPQLYLPQNSNDPENDGAAGSNELEAKEKEMYIKFFVFGGIIILAGLIAFWLIYKQKPVRTVVEKTAERSELPTNANAETAARPQERGASKETNSREASEVDVPSDTELSERLEQKNAEEKRTDTRTLELAEEAKQIATEDPESAAKYVKKLIGEG